MEDAECRIGQKHLKRVGILGGSFDPIHKGHLNIAQSAYEEFALDEVWFIPAGHSPNKDEKKMTAADMIFHILNFHEWKSMQRGQVILI